MNTGSRSPTRAIEPPPAPRRRAAAGRRGPLRLLTGLLLGAFAVLGCGAMRPALARLNDPTAADAPRPAPGRPADAAGDGPRGPWRELSPEQRQAIRQLSREQREALSGRPGARPGGGVPPARLTPRERRELREVIREEHERRAPPPRRGGKRP